MSWNWCSNTEIYLKLWYPDIFVFILSFQRSYVERIQLTICGMKRKMKCESTSESNILKKPNTQNSLPLSMSFVVNLIVYIGMKVGWRSRKNGFLYSGFWRIQYLISGLTVAFPQANGLLHVLRPTCWVETQICFHIGNLENLLKNMYKTGRLITNRPNPPWTVFFTIKKH